MNEHPDQVLLTRRRWDAYMMPLFLATAAIGIVRVWQTGQLQFAFAPVAVIPLWVMLRLLTPREGMLVATVGSTPGAAVMLWFAAAAMMSMAILFAIDVYVFHHPFRAPHELYHVALFAPPFVIMFTGAYWADRIRRTQMAKNSSDDDNGGTG